MFYHCKYCRESYKKYIREPPTKLNWAVLKNRETVNRWLYGLHNKVNKKLGDCSKPTFPQVWNKYESFRAKCIKTQEIKNGRGCTTPVTGARKKCVLNVYSCDKNGNVYSACNLFGRKKFS